MSYTGTSRLGAIEARRLQLLTRVLQACTQHFTAVFVSPRVCLSQAAVTRKQRFRQDSFSAESWSRSVFVRVHEPLLCNLWRWFPVSGFRLHSAAADHHHGSRREDQQTQNRIGPEVVQETESSESREEEEQETHRRSRDRPRPDHQTPPEEEELQFQGEHHSVGEEAQKADKAVGPHGARERPDEEPSHR